MKPTDFSSFTEDTQNRTPDDIRAMYGAISAADDHLRQCIRELLSRTLMDTSEDKPLEVDITLDVPGGPGMSCLENPRITELWQDPAEGVIWITFDECTADFDELRTGEQVQVVEALSASAPKAKDPSLIVYPMDALRGITDEEMAQLHPEKYDFDANAPYFHYDPEGDLLESLDETSIAAYNDGLPEEEQLVMATPEQAFELKWGDLRRNQMTDAEHTQYVEDLFVLYEKTGWADDFRTIDSDHSPRNGETFEVVRRATYADDDVEEEQMPMWLIKFDDDTTTLAYPDEITKLEREKQLK